MKYLKLLKQTNKIFMSQDFRLDKGGFINRDRKISFKFNGKKIFWI